MIILPGRPASASQVRCHLSVQQSRPLVMIACSSPINAVIVLDGASAFAPQSLPAATFSNQLGKQIANILTRNPDYPLVECLREGIIETAKTLSLEPGPSCPSSTVSIARFGRRHVDVLRLGDSLVVRPAGEYGDDRIENSAEDERAAYRARLAKGGGYNQEHIQLIRDLQTAQRRHRNRQDGF